MKCLVTAGPTYEPLDAVRRLTNFSTGKLGVELANHLAAQGHEVILLVGEQATYGGERRVAQVRNFTTTECLRSHLARAGGEAVDAVFHVAAVSDFAFGTVWRRQPGGGLSAVQGGKLSTREGALLAELVPTPKLILRLRDWFPHARLVGWKFEVDGGREDALRAARRQLAEAGTDLCVGNGPAFGPGFGLISREGESQLESAERLYMELAKVVPPV